MPNSLSLAEKLLISKEIGFDFLEISIDETDEKLERLNYTSCQRLEIVQAMFDADIRILTMCLSGHRKYPIGSEDETIRKRGMHIMEDAIKFAVDIGIRVIQIAGYDEYYQPSNARTIALFMDNLAKSVQIAARHGVVLAFETMETEFMNTVAKAKKIVERINSPYLKIYPDLGNITAASKTYRTRVEDDLIAGEGLIAAMHLKETKPDVFREVPFGEGFVDFKEAIKIAKWLNVRLFVGEFWDIGDGNWVSQAWQANAYLRENLDMVFSQ